MSSCGRGNCGCGASCCCGSGGGGCNGEFEDVASGRNLVVGLAVNKTYVHGFVSGGEPDCTMCLCKTPGGSCMCGSHCPCK